MDKTLQEFDEVIKQCKNVFVKKMKDYGIAWRILRITSITDQIYIKAQRIRSIEEKGTHKVREGVVSEFIGIVNYALMAQMQLHLGIASVENITMPDEEVIRLYNHYVQQAKELLMNKNHDYDEAWRNMRTSSYTDIILMKLLRIKQIENNHGNTLISEGLDANFYDIFNYAVFALIKFNEK
ncbi:MAG: DUF1599 domain-containing protein [Bacteroidales bacterium]|jgi:GTP cyclohydrolase II|nr:DUF1599 domain-containing protein [Bacteroidales bacterium]MDD2687094.1 DUF1599 domain-containing protein [Bacteroidales bacterium]MDD3331082.1 DUF1599 domain-containing protein [Bacteroidales bacterium]MDD3691092.1 DUF1599 domain-containing protein [Bacteroidales bacterium]MDD4044549.1 DUF1599 domain-containing protein [Bacteroidales bacterium]